MSRVCEWCEAQNSAKILSSVFEWCEAQNSARILKEVDPKAPLDFLFLKQILQQQLIFRGYISLKQ